MRQRGIAELIMYGVLALVAIGALVGVNAALKSHYVGPAKAKWDQEKSVLVGNARSLEADVSTCTAANKSLDAQFAGFRKLHDDQIRAAVELDKSQRANRAKAEKATEPQRQQNSMELFNLITQLGTPTGGLSCDQMDAALLQEAARRQKFYGPASPTPEGALNIRAPAEAPKANGRPPAVNPLAKPK